MSCQNKKPAPLLRRLAAMLYDTLIVIGILFVAGGIAVLANHGQAVIAGSKWFSGYLLVVVFSYFAYSWIKCGQTIGMRAWNLQLYTQNGEAMNLWRALIRFVYAIPTILCAGFGIWWILVDSQSRSWHDIWSRTYLLCTPQHKNSDNCK